MAVYPIHQIETKISNFSARKPSMDVIIQSFRVAEKSAATMKKEVDFFTAEGKPEIAALWQKAHDLYLEAASIAASGNDAYCKLWEAKAANEEAYQAFLNLKV